ncbi:MAG: hypothetical protein WAO95_04430 [Burkholderiales bacterium]
MVGVPNWKAVVQIVQQIHTEEETGHLTAGLALSLICMDTMAYLSRPAGQAAQTRAEFTAWVEKYLKGHPDQPYQYRGLDVYAARCAVLHSYGSEATLHRADNTIKIFAYHDDGKHMCDETADARLVLIGLMSFLNDVRIGAGSFLEDCEKDAALRALVEPRLGGLLTHSPIAAIVAKFDGG